MRRNKPRLQLALYARAKHPGSYHYAFFVAPKDQQAGPTTKHHVKNTLLVDDSGTASAPWRYEQVTVSDITAEQRILVRLVIAKVVTSREDVQRILNGVHVGQADDVDDTTYEVFSCQTWIRDAFEELQRQGAITAGCSDWGDVDQKARAYAEGKRAQGRWDGRWTGDSAVPLMDLLEDKELVE
nr:hypothetical protein CFP56_52527 [Quercus suber]